MENYIVSARKYRPDTFDTVVGQNALTATLKNAIASNKLAHAYLFCGPRGVGKTTCARIFAKTINCLNLTAEGEACNACESCVAFNEHRSYNIHELDAASNNSVEDIRQLVEMVRIPPQIGQYKVFIIDEVHMLSAAAFNAFLKTLEEPPMHAVFILATTEKHKILPTILSRCQIYDFNRITVKDIVGYLMHVADKEGIKYEQEALNVIAQKADGGMRDALSIFDQSASYTRGNISYQGVLDNLNVLDYDYYFRLTDALLKNNVVDALLIFNDVLNKGFEGSHFITGLTSHFRDLLVSKDEQTLALLEVGASIRERYQQQAQACTDQFLFQAMKLCNDCDLNLKVSKNKRLLVELTLIQVAQLTDEEPERPLGQSTINPTFKKETAKTANQLAPQQTTTTSAQKPQVAVESPKPNLAKPNPAKTTVQATAQQVKPASTTSSKMTMSERLQKSSKSERKTRVVSKEELGVASIKQMRNKLKKEEEKQHIVQKQEERKELKTDFTESQLNYHWQAYAQRMPIEQKALSVRMQGMRVKLFDNYLFEMVVENELVANDFRSIRTDIERYMRQALQNDFIEMQVRVSEPDENVRAFSRTEKFQQMASKNKALHELKNEFGLEFF